MLLQTNVMEALIFTTYFQPSFKKYLQMYRRNWAVLLNFAAGLLDHFGWKAIIVIENK